MPDNKTAATANNALPLANSTVGSTYWGLRSVNWAFLTALAVLISGCSRETRTPAAILAERQADMRELSSTVSTITDELSAPRPRFALIHSQAGRIDELAARMPALFDKSSSAAPGSRTTAAAWSGAIGITREIGKFQEATNSLVKASRVRDERQMLSAAADLQARCTECHAEFRSAK